MGAVAALYYLKNNKNHNNIYGLVLDSPYSDIKKVVKNYCKVHTSLPELVGDLGLSLLNLGIQSRAKFSLSDLKPVKVVSNIHINAIFVHSRDDKIVDSK